MRTLLGLLLLLVGCGTLPVREVLCSQTARCDAADGGSASDGGTQACSSGSSTALGGGVYACPGTFSSTGNTASQLCGTGYALCTSAGNADLAKCARVSGFFLANTYGVVDNQGNSMLMCNVATVSSGFNRTWYGCGTGTGRSAGSNTCGGFKTYLDCGSAGSFTCAKTGTTLDSVTNTSATSGVLCCGP